MTQKRKFVSEPSADLIATIGVAVIGAILGASAFAVLGSPIITGFIIGGIVGLLVGFVKSSGRPRPNGS